METASESSKQPGEQPYTLTRPFPAGRGPKRSFWRLNPRVHSVELALDADRAVEDDLVLPAPLRPSARLRARHRLRWPATPGVRK